MVSRHSLYFTRRAVDDLDGIVEYLLVELSNPAAASEFLSSLDSAMDTVRSFPESGTRVDNEFVSRGDIRKVPVGSYLAYYLLIDEEGKIIVIRIVHGKRNLEDILSELGV